MREVRIRSTSTKVKIAENGCAAATFAIRILHDQSCDHRVASRCDGRKRRCADSESANLATKKFSCLTPISPLAAGRTVAFLRIAAGDSTDGGLPQTVDGGPMRAIARGGSCVRAGE
jgi:hypothetical protein